MIASFTHINYMTNETIEFPPFPQLKKVTDVPLTAIDSISRKSTFFCRKTQTHFKKRSKKLKPQFYKFHTSCEDYILLWSFLVCFWSFAFFNVNCVINPWENECKLSIMLFTFLVNNEPWWTLDGNLKPLRFELCMCCLIWLFRI